MPWRGRSRVAAGATNPWVARLAPSRPPRYAGRMKRLAIVEPCSASWNDMTPAAGRTERRCASCRKDVHELATMTEDDARALLRSVAPGSLSAPVDPDEP